MSGYDYNLYKGGAIPDQGANGLPLAIADANLPTQLVQSPKMGLGTMLHYSAFSVESNLHTPANTYPQPDAAPVKAKPFSPTPQPKQPSLWRTVIRSVIGGGIKTGTSYAASGSYSSGGGGAPGLGDAAGSGSGGGGGGRATVGTVTAGGSRTA